MERYPSKGEMLKPKPGIKTTEFWITVATAVGAFAASLAGVVPDKYGALLATVAAGAYAVSRGLAKLNAAGVSDPTTLVQFIEDTIKALEAQKATTLAPTPAPPPAEPAPPATPPTT